MLPHLLLPGTMLWPLSAVEQSTLPLCLKPVRLPTILLAALVVVVSSGPLASAARSELHRGREALSTHIAQSDWDVDRMSLILAADRECCQYASDDMEILLDNMEEQSLLSTDDRELLEIAIASKTLAVILQNTKTFAIKLAKIPDFERRIVGPRIKCLACKLEMPVSTMGPYFISGSYYISGKANIKNDHEVKFTTDGIHLK